METIKLFLSTIDIFGITYTFRYKQKERYQTILGGFIFILFLILVLMVGIYYFIPFIKRKNYTIVYYTMNSATAEEVDLFQSESNIAFGVECDNAGSGKFSVHDILKMKANYVLYLKNQDGTYNKQTKALNYHQCSYNDFYSKYNNQMDYLGLSNYECLEKREGIIQGIYTDKIFSYFEFAVSAKNDSLLDDVENFLFENDCKFQIIYTNIIIDLKNYKEPISQYLDSFFIQLNPTLFIKRNMYFMNQYFSNDDYLLFNFGDEKPELKTLFSSYEEYSLYIGTQRKSTRPYNYDKFAKIYIRSALKKTIINRKYQKLIEFYADSSSILIALYEVIFLILNFIDYFYAYHSLAQQLFFFKGIEGNKNYNIINHRKQIRELISLIETQENKELNSFEDNLKISRNKSIDEELDCDKKEKGIFFYNNNNTKIFKSDLTIFKRSKINYNRIVSKNLHKPRMKFNEKYQYNSKENNPDSEDLFQGNKISKYGKSIKNSDILNINIKEKMRDILFKDSKNYHYRPSINLTSNAKMKRNIPKVKNSFNILEIIITQIFKCCMTQSLEIKYNINENANEIIFSKLDIIAYIRNMVLFDLMNQTLLNNDKRDIINFVCRPIISVENSQKNDFYDFYKCYEEKDFDKFINNIQDLIKKPDKIDEEYNLIFTSKEHLKKFL